jgi:hypothetical protein
MLKALAILLLLPIDVAFPRPPQEWVTATSLMLFVTDKQGAQYSTAWEGVTEQAVVPLPKQLANWTCKRGGADLAGQVTNFVECRAGQAIIVVDATCKKGESDADIGQVVLFDKKQTYGGRLIITCISVLPSNESK